MDAADSSKISHIYQAT